MCLGRRPPRRELAIDRATHSAISRSSRSSGVAGPGGHPGGRGGGRVPDTCQIGCRTTASDAGRRVRSNSHRPRSATVRPGRRGRRVPVEDQQVVAGGADRLGQAPAASDVGRRAQSPVMAWAPDRTQAGRPRRGRGADGAAPPDRAGSPPGAVALRPTDRVAGRVVAPRAAGRLEARQRVMTEGMQRHHPAAGRRGSAAAAGRRCLTWLMPHSTDGDASRR